VAVFGVVGCVVAAAYLGLAYPGTVEVAFIAVLVVFLAACVSLALFAPPALTSTMLPVYILESIRRYHADGGLCLDGRRADRHHHWHQPGRCHQLAPDHRPQPHDPAGHPWRGDRYRGRPCHRSSRASG
jgi:hypothetical protein